MKEYSKFSVLMSVYKNDRPEWVREAVESVSIKQTLQPDEVFIVVDGPVGDELANELRALQKEIPSIWIEWCSENRGLGLALQYGLERVKYDIVARMDSDDIAASNRFEKQISFMQQHPEVELLGGQISEFIDEPDNIVGNRIVPCTHDEIVMWLKGRCPFNHMSVTMLRSRVIACGNYLDWFWNEDYYLWIRMALAGCKFANLPDTLVNVRVGKDMYARRGGWKYFKSEEGLQKYMWKHGMISMPRYLLNTCIRFGVQVVIPNSVRGWMFRKLFRK